MYFTTIQALCHIRARLILAGLTAIMAASSGVAAEPREVAETCLAGLQQARAKIRTFKCVMECEAHDLQAPVGRSPQVSRLTWIEADGVALATQVFDRTTNRYRWDGKSFKLLRTDGTTTSPGFGQIAGTDGINSVTSVWREALFEPEGSAWADEFRPENIRGASHELLGSVQCWRVDLSNGSWRKSYWFDPARNYLVLKTLFSAMPSKAAVYVSTVNVVRDYGQSVFFPETVVTTAQINDTVRPYQSFKFTGVKVNAAVDQTALQLRFPRGTSVTDRQAGITYVVGDNEQPVGPVEPAAKPRGPDPDDVHMPTGVVLPGQPERPWYWVWAAAGVVISAAVVVYTVLRRRSH